MQCANPSENNNTHVLYLFPGSIISRHQIQIGLGAFSENWKCIKSKKIVGLVFLGNITACCTLLSSCYKVAMRFLLLIFFSYVTKTCQHLSTYSRKPGNYNGTIIFEVDIMKKFSPLKSKFTFFATVKTKIKLFFSVTHFTLSRKQLKQ